MQETNCFDIAVMRFGCRGGFSGQRSSCGRTRIDRIGFALGSARTTVRAVDVDDLDVGVVQCGRQRGSVASGSFHSDTFDSARRGDPGDQLGDAGSGAGELSVVEITSEVVDECNVVRVSECRRRRRCGR